MHVMQVVGYKNAGKTTLVCALVAALAAEGLRVGTIKRDAHDGEFDTPDTDSWRHRRAGAVVTAIASPSRTAWFAEEPETLESLLDGMRERGADAVVVEGFKTARYPKIVIVRSDEDDALLALTGIVAIVRRGDCPRIGEAAAKDGIPVFAAAMPPAAELLADVVRLFTRPSPDSSS